MSTDPWVWTGAVLTIAIFTYLWKENPLYRLAEHIFIGISVGYGICITWYNVLEPKLWTPLVEKREFSLIIPTILAFLMLFRFSKRHGWISFWPLAFMIGFVGYSIPAVIDAALLKQLQATINVPMSGGVWVVFSLSLIHI